MSYIYWFEEDVHESVHTPLVEEPYVDDRFQNPYDRYGYWNGDEYSEWIHVPLKSFPKDFQMALILLGVT